MDRQMNAYEKQLKNFEELLANSSLGYHSVDRQGTLLRVNDVWLKTLGYERDEVIGHCLSEFIHPNFREKFAKNLPKLISCGLIKDLTFMMLHRDGYPVELVFNGTVIKDAAGNFQRTAASFHRPLTVYGDADNSDVPNIVSQSRAELMREMMTAVAHQWRQPLNALGLIVQDTYELAQIAGINNPEIKENTDTAMNLVLKMSDIIDEFRDFFISSEKDTELNTVTVVMQCLKAMISQLQESDIDFSVICECSKNYFSIANETSDSRCIGHQSNILANENELKQVIINVISNARYAMIQAMDRGMISKGILKIHILNKENTVEMSVQNNGMTIPKKVINKVFDPYFSTKKEGEGLGLGLYFSKLLIEKRMRGAIGITNLDDGVMVTITLPLAAQKISAQT